MRLYLRKPGATIMDRRKISLKNWRLTVLNKDTRAMKRSPETQDRSQKRFSQAAHPDSCCTYSSIFKFAADVGIRSITRLIESILSFDSQSTALVYKSGFVYPPIVLSTLARWHCPYFRALDILQVNFQLEKDSTLLCWLVLDQLRRQGYQFYVAGCGVWQCSLGTMVPL